MEHFRYPLRQEWCQGFVLKQQHLSMMAQTQNVLHLLWWGDPALSFPGKSAVSL